MKTQVNTFGKVTYQFFRRGRTWEFTYPVGDKTFTLCVACGGRENATKVAEMIAKSVAKHGKITEFVKMNIYRMVHF